MTTTAPTCPVDLNRLPLPDLYRELTRDGLTTRLFEIARDEDVSELGDVTSQLSITQDQFATAYLVSRSPGIAAGLAAVPETLRAFAARCEFKPVVADGDRINRGSTLGTLAGPLRDILTVERTVLNTLGRLSGIATRAAEFVAAIGAGTRARLYDTRKTTPGLRALEKYAVRCGGACCHRVGLFDAVLLKDNHIAAVPDEQLGTHVCAVARAARTRHPGQLRFVEVEVDRIEQLRSIVAAQIAAPTTDRVDIVLLDNMNPERLIQCVHLRDQALPRLELEASGGISLASVRAVALTGVERISTGALTHGSTWLDIGLDIEPGTGPSAPTQTAPR